MLEKEQQPREPKPTSSLSRTLEDHQRAGSTVQDDLEVLRQNPGKTLAETMSDEDLAAHVRKAVAAIDEVYTVAFVDPQTPLGERANAMGAVEKNVLKLKTDIEYLRSIGRLPEFANFDPQEKYPLE